MTILSLVADAIVRYPLYLLLAAVLATVRPLALQPASSHTILILTLPELTHVLTPAHRGLRRAFVSKIGLLSCRSVSS